MARRMREFYPNAYRGEQTRFGTAQAPDVDGTPWWIECKVGAQPNIKNALEQAWSGVVHTLPARPPVAICKWDRGPAIVGMYLDDWMAMIRLSKHQGL